MAVFLIWSLPTYEGNIGLISVESHSMFTIKLLTLSVCLGSVPRDYQSLFDENSCLLMLQTRLMRGMRLNQRLKIRKQVQRCRKTLKISVRSRGPAAVGYNSFSLFLWATTPQYTSTFGPIKDQCSFKVCVHEETGQIAVWHILDYCPHVTTFTDSYW